MQREYSGALALRPASPRLTGRVDRHKCGMMKRTAAGTVLLVLAALLACRCNEDRRVPSAGAKPTTAAPPAVADAALPEDENPALVGAKYQADVGTIPDDCADARAVLATAPRNARDWSVARQVFVANPQFGFVSEFSDKPGQVVFAEADHQPSKGVALVAQCREGVTCKHLAAAYKTVLPTSSPELFCGAVPVVGALRPSQVLDPTAPLRSQLPRPNDLVGQCVRLAACRAAVTGRLDGDPASDCKKNPRSFPLKCAKEFPCAAVLACLEGAG
jgi:hypothetical protein